MRYEFSVEWKLFTSVDKVSSTLQKKEAEKETDWSKS
jgi:hypothetical protein